MKSETDINRLGNEDNEDLVCNVLILIKYTRRWIKEIVDFERDKKIICQEIIKKYKLSMWI